MADPVPNAMPSPTVCINPPSMLPPPEAAAGCAGGGAGCAAAQPMGGDNTRMRGVKRREKVENLKAGAVDLADRD
ncbi:unnamed protein product [Closterium sp. NIES-54]